MNHLLQSAEIHAESASANATMTSGCNYTIDVATDVTAVLALRQYWQELPLDPNSDIDFYLTVVRSNSAVLRPHVIVLRKDGVVRAILAGRIEMQSIDVHLGYKTLSSPPVRFLTLIHGGRLGDDCEEVARLLVNSVVKCLREREADVAWFHGLNPDSALYEAVDKAGGAFSRDLYPTRFQRWRLQIPEQYEELYRRRSSNTRHNAKRYSKRLLDSFGNQMTVRSFRHLTDVDTIVADTEVVATKTYLRGLGVGFVNNDQTRQLMKLAAYHGWLRAHILYIAGKPCAFWNGFLYRKTFFTWTTGYDPEFSNVRPGLFLLQKVLEDLCHEGAADEVDFGFGDAQYKQEWADRDLPHVSQLLFGPSPKAVVINLLRTPLIAASNAARILLERCGALDRLKRAWRDRVTK